MTAEGGDLRLASLVELVRSIGAERDLDLLLAKAMEAARQQVSADRSSLFLYDAETDELWSKVAQGLATSELRFPAGKGLAGHTARTGEIINIPDAYDDPRFNQDIDKKTGYRTRQVLCVPLRRPDGQVTGTMQVLNSRDGKIFDAEAIAHLVTVSELVAVAVENAMLHEENENLFEQTVMTTAQAIEERDPATSGHVWRVAAYAIKLAHAVHERSSQFGESYDRDRLRQLRYASLLHDVGKIGVREAVLNKSKKLDQQSLALLLERLRRMSAEAWVPFFGGPYEHAAEVVSRASEPGFLSEQDAAELKDLKIKGWVDNSEYDALSIAKGTLTDSEWEDMRSHPERSYRVLKMIPWPPRFELVPDLARDHHEQINGNGYPRGLRGDQISFDARILAVTDVYDALIASDRPYKAAIPHAKAVSIMESMAESEALDSRLVKLFFEAGCYKIEPQGGHS